MFDYKGRTALITGAGQGMGFGIAKAMADHGAKVYINDLYIERADAAAKLIGPNAVSVPGDITDPKIIQMFADKIGKLDILCNNAGVPEGMPTSLRHADVMGDSDYDRQMDLNFKAVRHLCATFTPGMRERKYGRILITTSESHRLGLNMGLSHYASAKAAALGYMRCLAAEVGHDGITANAVSLGSMNNFPGHERAKESTLVGRSGNSDDVGAAALYLCSSEASWITGQTIPLNGGAITT